MPQTRINAGFAKHFCLFKLNDCILVSTISCGSDFIKTTTFIRIIQSVFFYRRILGQNLVTPHLPVLSCVHVLASQNQGIMGNIHNDFLLKHVAGRALHVDGGNGFICFSAHKFYLLSVIVVRWLQNQTVSFTHPQYTREGA